MLRNPLASPDIIGISSGASAAAVFAIVVLSLGETGGLGRRHRRRRSASALLIYLLSYRDGVAGTRLILIGIGDRRDARQRRRLRARARPPSGTCRRRCAG